MRAIQLLTVSFLYTKLVEVAKLVDVVAKLGVWCVHVRAFSACERDGFKGGGGFHSHFRGIKSLPQVKAYFLWYFLRLSSMSNLNMTNGITFQRRLFSFYGKGE